MKLQIKQVSDKYNNLETQHEKIMKEYSLLKTEHKFEKDKNCECDSKLKNCNFNIMQKETEMTNLTNTIMDLNTKILILQTNPPKGTCDDVNRELKKQLEINKKCEEEKNEINKKYTNINLQLTTITKKYDDLLITQNGNCHENGSA